MGVVSAMKETAHNAIWGGPVEPPTIQQEDPASLVRYRDFPPVEWKVDAKMLPSAMQVMYALARVSREAGHSQYALALEKAFCRNSGEEWAKRNHKVGITAAEKAQRLTTATTIAASFFTMGAPMLVAKLADLQPTLAGIADGMPNIFLALVSSIRNAMPDLTNGRQKNDWIERVKSGGGLIQGASQQWVGTIQGETAAETQYGHVKQQSFEGRQQQASSLEQENKGTRQSVDQTASKILENEQRTAERIASGM